MPHIRAFFLESTALSGGFVLCGRINAPFLLGNGTIAHSTAMRLCLLRLSASQKGYGVVTKHKLLCHLGSFFFFCFGLISIFSCSIILVRVCGIRRMMLCAAICCFLVIIWGFFSSVFAFICG